MADRKTISCNPRSGLQSEPSTENEGIHNFGNPVFTFKGDLPVQLPPAVECTAEEQAAGFNCEPVNIMYKTANSEYGSRPPTVHSVPLVFHSKSQRFSDQLGKCGMPRNRGMNCSLDKSKVPLR